MSMYESEFGPGEVGFETWELTGESGTGELGFETWEAEEEFALENELAMELLEITSEAELDQFLGKLVRGAVKGVGGFMRSSAGRALGGVLKSVAKTALPMAGAALGSVIAPGVGTAIGGKLGSLAGSLLEVEEAEMMGEEEAEQEAARRFVRFARSAARNAAMAPANVPPRIIARSAAISAAQRHAPTLVRSRGVARVPGWRSRRAARYGGYPASAPDWVARPRPVRRRPARVPWGWDPSLVQPLVGGDGWADPWGAGSADAGSWDAGSWDPGSWSAPAWDAPGDPYAGGYEAAPGYELM